LHFSGSVSATAACCGFLSAAKAIGVIVHLQKKDLYPESQVKVSYVRKEPEEPGQHSWPCWRFLTPASAGYYSPLLESKV